MQSGNDGCEGGLREGGGEVAVSEHQKRRTMIQILVSAANLFAAVSSALAAYHWYHASQVVAPRELRGFSMWSSRDNPGPNVGVDAGPLVEFARESGRRNKVAALWSAAAALFAFVAWALGTWVSWTSAAH
jgi:hypothetical protein